MLFFTNPLNKIQIIINHFHIHYSANFIIKFSHMTIIIIDFIIILTGYFHFLIHFNMIIQAHNILIFSIKFQLIFGII